MTIESLSTDRSPTADELLRELGSRAASGVLEISHPADEVSHVWVREGRIYAMHVPGYRPALGIRLLSGGLVSPEQLSAAAAEQRERFPTHLIGQVLVGMGLVSQAVIDAFVREQVLDQMADLLDLPIEEAQFHPGRRISQDIIEPTDIDELLHVARQRRAHRADILAVVGGPQSVPQLSPPGVGLTQTPLGPYDWALLCRVDGRRDITELARVCGFTVQESAQIVADLALTGLLVLPAPANLPDEPLAPVVTLRPDSPVSPPVPEWQFDGTDAGEPEPVGELLAEFSAFVHDAPLVEPAPVVAAEPTDVVAAEPAPVVAAEPTDVVAAEPADVVAAAPAPVVAAEPADAFAPREPFELDGVPLGIPAATDGPGADPAWDASPFQASEPVPATQAEVPDHAAEGSPAPAGMFPQGAPVAPAAESGFADTSVFMRELSSLSDEPQDEAPVVTRLVVPLTEPRRKRRFWSR